MQFKEGNLITYARRKPKFNSNKYQFITTNAIRSCDSSADWTWRTLASRANHVSLGTSKAQNHSLPYAFELLYFVAFDYSDTQERKVVVIYPSPLRTSNRITHPRSNPVRKLHARKSFDFPHIYPSVFYFPVNRLTIGYLPGNVI